MAERPDVVAHLARLARTAGGDVDVTTLLDAVLLAAARSAAGQEGDTTPPPGGDAPDQPPPEEDSPDLTAHQDHDPAPPRDPYTDQASEPTAAVWLDDRTGTRTVPGRRLSVARASALPDALDIGRALRPLRRPWLAGVHRRLDVDATVEHYTRTGMLVPRLAPAPEPWLEVVVVLDRGTAMAVWDETVRTLTRTLRTLAAFRDVRLWGLDHHPGGVSVLTDHHGHSLPMDPTAASHTQPARRLLLVVSDCAAPAWQEDALWRTLHTWGRTAPVALVNPLPRRLWQRSGLDLPRTTARAAAPASSLKRLIYRRPRLLRDTGEEQWQAMPVLQLAAGQVLAWARTLMRTDPEGCEAVLVPATGRPPRRRRGPAAPPAAGPPSDDEIRARAQAFADDLASPAVRLAVAAAPLDSFTLPVLDVLRDRLVPEAQLEDTAEFLTAGLLTATRHASADTVYRFHPEAAGHLNDLLTRDRLWDTHFALTDHLEAHPQAQHGITTVLHSPDGAEALPVGLRPVAHAAAITARLLGIEPVDTAPADPRRAPAPREDASMETLVAPLGLVIEVALAHRSSAQWAARHLRQFGYRAPELPAGWDAPLTRNDIVLLSRSRDGEPPWLDPDYPVAFGHVLQVALVTGDTPRAVARRLETWGFTLPAAAELPDIPATSEDAQILSRDVDGEGPWLEADTPVRTEHLLIAAARTGNSPRDIARRLREFGRLPADDERDIVDARLTERDAVLMSRHLDGTYPWLDRSETVSLPQIVNAALSIQERPRAVARRLRSWGFATPDPADVPDAEADAEELRLLSRDVDGTPPWLAIEREVPLAHVWLCTVVTGTEQHEVARRLRKWGYAVAEPPAGAELPTDTGDLRLLSRDLDGETPWLDPGELVPYGHLLAAAVRAGTGPREIARRLQLWGYTVPDPAELPDVPARTDDPVLLSRDLDGVGPWLDTGEPVSYRHVLLSAVKTRSAPHAVAMRLRQWGLTVSEPVNAPDVPFTSDDVRLLSRDLDSNHPWLDVDEPVGRAHVLLAAVRMERAPREIARRLGDLGFSVPALDALPDVRCTSGDELLLSGDLDGQAPWLELEGGQPVPFQHLVLAAARMRTGVGDVARRLRELGLVPADPPPGAPEAPLTEQDAALLSRNLDGEYPWIGLDDVVPHALVLNAAAGVGRSARDVAGRLRELGAVVPDPAEVPDVVPSQEDLLLISEDFDASSPWLEADEPVPYGHLLNAAARSGTTPREVAVRLRELGFRTPDPTALADLPLLPRGWPAVSTADRRLSRLKRLRSHPRAMNPDPPTSPPPPTPS
ncbi:wHTH domain-containing protein [Streptomyces zhihengii]